MGDVDQVIVTNLECTQNVKYIKCQIRYTVKPKIL